MCLTKLPIESMFKLLSVIYLQNIMHCDILFLVVKTNGFGTMYCCPGIKILEPTDTVISCILTLPDGGLPNGTKLSIFCQISIMFCSFFKR